MVKISTSIENHIITLAIDGEIDASSSIELDSALGKALEQAEQRVFIDGSNLHYISSAGLGVFMSYLEDIKKRQIDLVIFGLTEKVHNVFGILGLDQLLVIVNTIDDARKLMNDK